MACLLYTSIVYAEGIVGNYLEFFWSCDIHSVDVVFVNHGVAERVILVAEPVSYTHLSVRAHSFFNCCTAVEVLHNEFRYLIGVAADNGEHLALVDAFDNAVYNKALREPAEYLSLIHI